VIMLGDMKPTAHAIPSEVLSARYQLDHRGLLDEEEFDRRLSSPKPLSTRGPRSK
jgi:hypothetical protein